MGPEVGGGNRHREGQNEVSHVVWMRMAWRWYGLVDRKLCVSVTVWLQDFSKLRGEGGD